MRGCLNRIARVVAGLDDEQWQQLTPDQRGEFGATLDWGQLTYAHTSRIRAMLLEQGWSPAHVNKHLNALRCVLNEAWRLGLMDSETYHRAADVGSVDGIREAADNDVPSEVVAVLLGVCDAETADGTDAGLLIGARDGAIIATLYSTGCRRSELAAFTMADYRPGDRSLKVRGKGDKERRVYLIPDAVGWLERWIAVRGRTPGALFPLLYKDGRKRIWINSPSATTGGAIGPSAVEVSPSCEILRQLAKPKMAVAIHMVSPVGVTSIAAPAVLAWATGPVNSSPIMAAPPPRTTRRPMIDVDWGKGMRTMAPGVRTRTVVAR